MRVFKYRLALVPGEQQIIMPPTERIVHVHAQGTSPCLWALVDPDAARGVRTFQVVPTGHEEVPENGRYVGTVHVEWLVWHVFEIAKQGEFVVPDA